jgi:putative phosphoesterase
LSTPRNSSLSRRNVSASSISSVGRNISTTRKIAAAVAFAVESGRHTSRDSTSSSVVLPQLFSGEVIARRDAPVHAVRGNVDYGAWSANLPVTQRIEIDGFRIYVLHILAELDPQAADNVDAVIYGHSHQPKIETKNGTLFFNPGSAGPRRFRLPITVGRMTAEHGKLRAEIVELSVER